MKVDRVGHFTRFPAIVGKEPCRFLFDTGIGVNVVSPRLADRLSLRPVGASFAGRRMSGQWVEAELVYLPPLTVGDRVCAEQMAAVAELGPEEDEDGYSGILGLSAFADVPVTVDPRAKTVTLGDPGRTAFRVPLDIRPDGPSIAAFAELVLPGGRTISVEVDTGSDCLILDATLLRDADVSSRGELETTEGVDETGFEWVRLKGLLNGGVHFSAAPLSRQESPCVVFQDIIHDGLIGTDYLDRFRYTVDVEGEQLLLTPI